MTETSQEPHYLYYRYGGSNNENQEPERPIHGPASKAECERVRNARLIEVAGVAIDDYMVKPISPKRKTRKTL